MYVTLASDDLASVDQVGYEGCLHAEGSVQGKKSVGSTVPCRVYVDGAGGGRAVSGWSVYCMLAGFGMKAVKFGFARLVFFLLAKPVPPPARFAILKDSHRLSIWILSYEFSAGSGAVL